MRSRRWVDLGREQDIYLACVDWRDPQHLSFQRQSRDQKQLDLVEVALDRQRVLAHETSPTWVPLHNSLRFLEDGSVLWSSDTGFQHLYRIDSKGKTTADPTATGRWTNCWRLMRRPARPTCRHRNLARKPDLRGIAGRRAPAPVQGTGHSATFARNASVYVDSWSNSTTPPQIELFRANGEKIATLVENDLADPRHPARYRDAPRSSSAR